MYLEPPVDLGAFHHIADYLFEVGPTTGEHSVSWCELEAWQKQTGVTLGEFRAGAIVALSREFLAALGKSRELITLEELCKDLDE